jgi:O-antigen/teichoic acid export membrane protein
MPQSNLRMMSQIVFSASKLGFLTIAVTWFSGISVILAGWVASLVISIVFGELLMRRRNYTLLTRPNFELLFCLRYKVVHHYRLDLGMMAPSTLLPYLVTVLLSPSANAAFTVIWMVFGVASIVPSTLATVLFPIIQAEPHHYRNRMNVSLGVSLIFALAFGIFIFFLSSDIVRVFNPAYAVIGGQHLRILGFGMIGSVIRSHIVAAARLNNRMREASVSIFLGAVLELMSVVIGAHFGGLEGLAWAWMSATLIEAGVLLLINPVYGRTYEPRLSQRLSKSLGSS